jgi:hypothetical protein
MHFNRREFIKLGAASLAAAFQPLLLVASANARPNVLIVLSEANQHSPRPRPLTTAPTLQRLAREGFTFENAIQQYPFGDPAWEALLTGHWPRLGRGKELTLAGVFASAGYVTSYVGDWKLGERQDANSFCGFQRLLTCSHWTHTVDCMRSILAKSGMQPFCILVAQTASSLGRDCESARVRNDNTMRGILRELEIRNVHDHTIVFFADLCNKPASESALEARVTGKPNHSHWVVHWRRGILPGLRSRCAMAPIDVMPTVCALASLPVSPNWAGRNYAGLMLG